jgi:23S rRNA A2030 N6-methylase RlmJ
MAYDHRAKAGNQVDVVKHVALLAMARHALAETRSVFKYGDAYAGPAGSVLLPGGEWVNGVGKVNRSGEVNSQDVRKKVPDTFCELTC